MKQNYNTMDTESLRRSSRTASGRGFLKAIFLAALMLATMPAIAQDVTVTVTKVRQTLPSSLADLIDHPNQTVNIMLQNNTNQQAKVYLKLSLTSDYVQNGQPLELLTQEKGNTRPCITLSPGEVRRFNSIMDFSDHFSGRLTTTATADFLTLTRIPEGSYSLCLEVYRWMEFVADDGSPMSRDCAQFTVCYTGSAPELITPIMVVNDNVRAPKPPRVPKKGKDGFVNMETRDPNTVQPSRLINIRWTEVITNCPQTAPINYYLKIVRVSPGLSPEYAIDHAPVVFSKNCGRNNFCQIDTLRNLDVPFERGATYAMQVEARERGANPTLEIANEGKSQIMTFSWGKATYNVNNGNNGNGNQENTSKESSSEESGSDDVLASLRQSYVVSPYRDATSYSAVLAKFADESSQVPAEDKSIQVKYHGNYNDHIVSTKMDPFDITWMPVRGNNLRSVRYTVDLFEDLGLLSDIETRPAMLTKTINVSANSEDSYVTSTEPMSVGDPKWKDTLQEGKKYLVRVKAVATYRYYDYKINKTIHYVNGIEADTEYDTVKTAHTEIVNYSSTMNFQWGLDSSMLDRVLPPQFTGPINRSTANWDDTSFMHFDPTVETLWNLDNFNISWKKASNLNIEDEDTALYNLYIYEAAKGKDIKAIVKGEAKYHKDSIDALMLKGDILDSLKEGKIYVARVKVIIPDTTTYFMCNHGWSHPIAFTLKKDTNNYSTAIDITNACFPNDTAKMNRKDLITPKVDSLVNSRVKLKMGRFNMVVQSGQLDDKKRYSGEGYVEWTPMYGYGVGIKVKFDTIQINKDFQVIAGTARSMTEDSNNYLNLNMGKNKYGAGFDMYADQGVQMLNQYAGELGSTGEDVKKWYDIINKAANPVSQLTHSIIEGGGAVDVVTTPIKASNKMLGGDSVENVSVAINDFFFSPVTAQMNLLAIYSSFEDNLYLPFLATNICVEPDKFISDSIGTVYLFMAQDMEVPLSDGYTLTFKCPTKLSDMSNGTHVAIDTGGFKEIAIDAEISFGTKDQPGNKVMAVDIKQNGIVKPDKPVKAYFYTKFKSWSNWIVKIGMDPFTVVGCEDFAFVPTGSGMWYDHSLKETPDAIKLPKNYMTLPKKKEQWRGFYLDKFAVMLPQDISNTFIDLTGDTATVKKEETKFVTYSYGVNGQIKDSTEVIPDGSRINFSASQLIIDSCGLSVDVSANNLLRLETKNGGGWAFSIDTVGVRFLKSSFKEGYILGKLKIPLFTGNMKYNCSLGSDSIDFAITPGDSLQLDLYVANVDLDKKSTHFRIIHDYGGNTYKSDYEGDTEYTYKNQDATTRVDLTLNGKITIDFKKFNIPVDLPKIKFENMYMRNYTSKTVDMGKKGKVESYKFGKMDFNIGNWSKASPQKYIGIDYTDSEVKPDGENENNANANPGQSMGEGKVSGFKYNLTTLSPKFEQTAGKSSTYTAGLVFGGSMSLGIGKDQSIGASAGFGISCEVNTSSWDISNWDGTFDSARVKTDIGPLSVDGFISHSRNDAVFGNCWKGMLDVTLMEVVQVKMGAGFGTSQRVVKAGDTTNFDWWYFEGAANLSSAGIPLGPLAINGFGGAFAYNMQPKTLLTNMSGKDLMGGQSLCDNMVSNDGSNYTPQYDAWIARAGVSIILTGAESTLNANGILGLRIANGHFAGISLQVDAKMLSSYDKDNKEASNAALTVAAFIDYSKGDMAGDWKLNFAANIKSEINLTSLIKGSGMGEAIAKAYTYPTSSTEAKKDGKSGGMSSSWLDKKVQDSKDYAEEDDKVNKAKSGEGVGGSATLQIPIDFYVKHYPDGMAGPSGKQTEWFFAVGRPNKSDRMSFSASMDLVIAKASVAWDAYIMTGNYFPGGFQLPEIPQDVQQALGSKYASYSAKNKLPNLDKAGGFAFGGSFHAELEVDMFLWLKASTTLGFDLGLLATNGSSCPGYSSIGKNGFYGMGQLYAMFEGQMGLSLNLGFWKGHLTLASASVAALLQGGGPNPTWAYGLLAFKASCLGGLIKINTSVDFSMGHVCVPGNSDPLANVKLFQNVTPAFNNKTDSKKSENVQSAYTTGTIVSNLPWNEPVLLCADQKYGKGTTTRKFQFVIVKSQCVAKYTKRTYNASEKDFTLKFSPNYTETNMQYFEWTKGGLPENSDIKIKLKGRAFEYRPSYTSTDKKKDEINLSDAQRKTDYYYTLTTNGYTKTSYLDPSHSQWRDPIFTDNDVTVHKSWTQDTTFYIRTSPKPDNLDEAVVFTWPYNGDPMFPVNEFVTIGGRKRALIYLYQDCDFLSKSDADNREIKAFLVLRGISASNDALACDYIYHKNGYLGSSSSTPCIEIVLPSKFNENYQNYDMAIRLLLIKKDAYNATLKQLQAQANASTSSMQQKQETQKKSAAARQRMANMKRWYSNSYLEKSVEYQQLKAATEKEEGVSDTMMSYARKMLKNDYAICLQTGSPIYTLYFRLYTGHLSYAEILGDNNRYLNFLFSGPSIENQTTSMSKTLETYSYTDEEAAKYAYWFAPYTPTDKKAYNTNITLPPIVYPVLDWGRAKFKYHEYSLYSTYCVRLINMDNAIKNTWSPTQRPVQHGKSFHLKESKEWTTNDMGSASEQSAMYSLFSQGFVPAAGRTYESDFTNLQARMKDVTTSGMYVTVDGYQRASFPKKSNNKILAPNIIKLTVAYPKWRYDSTSIGQPAQKTIGGKTFSRPEYSYSTKYTNIDEAIPAMFNDIKRYHDFYQTLFDYAVNFHCHGYSHKCDQYEHLIKYTYRNNQLTSGDFPYAITKSTLATWWMYYWRGIFYAGHLKRQDYKYDNFKWNAIPYDKLTYLDGQKASYWMQYVLHWDYAPYHLEESKGLATQFSALFNDDFNNNKTFGRWRTTEWFNGKTTGGGTFTEESSGGLINVSKLRYGNINSADYSIRYIPITYYYVHGGSSSYIFGYMADAVKKHKKGSYQVMANATLQSTDTYNYGISDKAVKRLKDNSGITFRAINTKNEEDYAKNLQSSQWE